MLWVYARSIFYGGSTMELWLQIKDNFGFLVMCGIIAAFLYFLAKLASWFLPNRRTVTPARKVSIIGVCAAIATVLHMLDFPLLFLAPGFYKLDFSELPVMLCGFYLGPTATVVCEALKILLKLLFKGTTTAFVGDFANFVVGCSFVLPASVIYHSKPGKKSALVGMAIGTIVLTCFGSFMNVVYMIPKFSQLFGLPIDAIVAMGSAVNPAINSVNTLVLFAVVPFNLLKGILVSFITFLLYKRISPILHKNDARKMQKKITKEM